MTGEITSIDNCGTIVVVWLDSEGKRQPVFFDHRPFAHLLQCEGCHAADLIGRPARYEEETFSFED